MCLEQAGRTVRKIGGGCCNICAIECLGRSDSRYAAKRLMDEEREEGQALLRSMITSPGTSADDVDWAAVIAKANELHCREQEWLRKQDRKDRRLFHQRQRKALQKRKRFDAIGSFSVNLLTYRMMGPEHDKMTRGDGYTGLEQEDDDDEDRRKFAMNQSSTSVGSTMTNEGDTASFGSGGLSPSSGVYMCRSEENLEPIEEQTEVALDQSSSL
uniref:Uncharacterized protein n=1 Tax=Grammatophora oceanica TaxID=210454 RepID=A0A7S1UP92_9STRA|mmetsp:Transcript_12983/g.19165  ORF Transcript_12983/g.19165 Transcript_12983/m.19165 type:complete len:214 (+) Transcript_12983:475-1116(+)